jgi:hypothetical protein
MRTDRLEAFVRAMRYKAPGLDPSRILRIIARTLEEVADEDPGELEREADDRAFVKVIALTIAYYDGVRSAMSGEFELDFREEAILTAVVAYLNRPGRDA